jgi:hypothetical protein
MLSTFLAQLILYYNILAKVKKLLILDSYNISPVS